MSTDRPTPERSDCGLEVAAYLLGALEPEEATAFERHMTRCVACRDEVAELRVVVEALPLAPPQLPAPAKLKKRVMAAVRREPRESKRSPQRRGLRGRAPWPAFGRPVLERPAFGAAVLLAAIAVTLGALELASGTSTAPRLVQASVFGSSGRAVLRLDGGHAELTMTRMPLPPQGQVYEVWLNRGAQPSPTAALFSVTSSGAASVDVPGDLHGVRSVLVTPEPLGGSVVPTHAPVIVAPLPAQ